MPRPRNVSPTPATDLVRQTEDRRSILLRQVEDDIDGKGLEPWQERFCKWLAMHGHTKRAKQAEIASLLAGHDVSVSELIALRIRPAWKALWIAERDVPRALDKAKADFASLIEDSPAQYKRMLDKAVGDSDVRAATGLLVPLLDRAMPKKEESAVKTPDLHIHLSVQQAKGLEATPLTVSAEEVAEYVVEDVA